MTNASMETGRGAKKFWFSLAHGGFEAFSESPRKCKHWPQPTIGKFDNNRNTLSDPNGTPGFHSETSPYTTTKVEIRIKDAS
jgi:hypothetical protein